MLTELIANRDEISRFADQTWKSLKAMDSVKQTPTKK
jgi:hypothetical protein